MSFTTAPRRRLVLLLVAVLVAALGGFVTQMATAGPPSSTGNSPTSIEIVGITSTRVAPSGLPEKAEPYVIVKQGDTFSVKVRFLDSKGKPTFFDVDKTLTMTAVSNAGFDLDDELAVDVFNSDDRAVAVDVAKGQRTAVLTGHIKAAVNRVQLTVSTKEASPAVPVTGSSDVGIPDPLGSQLFDVLSDVDSIPIDPKTAIQTGIGGSDGVCTSATEHHPLCGTLLLPNGADGSDVFMSLGACDRTEYTNCGVDRQDGLIVQVLADLTVPDPNKPDVDVDLYTNTSPATLILRCDTSLCGTGAIRGIPVNFSFLGNGPLDNGTEQLDAAPACPRRGTVGRSQELCVDYVQSKRDGSSDTILYLLFTQDLRGGIG